MPQKAVHFHPFASPRPATSTAPPTPVPIPLPYPQNRWLSTSPHPPPTVAPPPPLVSTASEDEVSLQSKDEDREASKIEESEDSDTGTSTSKPEQPKRGSILRAASHPSILNPVPSRESSQPPSHRSSTSSTTEKNSLHSDISGVSNLTGSTLHAAPSYHHRPSVRFADEVDLEKGAPRTNSTGIESHGIESEKRRSLLHSALEAERADLENLGINPNILPPTPYETSLHEAHLDQKQHAEKLDSHETLYLRDSRLQLRKRIFEACNSLRRLPPRKKDMMLRVAIVAHVFVIGGVMGFGLWWDVTHLERSGQL